MLPARDLQDGQPCGYGEKFRSKSYQPSGGLKPYCSWSTALYTTGENTASLSLISSRTAAAAAVARARRISMRGASRGMRRTRSAGWGFSFLVQECCQVRACEFVVHAGLLLVFFGCRPFWAVVVSGGRFQLFLSSRTGARPSGAEAPRPPRPPRSLMMNFLRVRCPHSRAGPGIPFRHGGRQKPGSSRSGSSRWISSRLGSCRRAVRVRALPVRAHGPMVLAAAGAPADVSLGEPALSAAVGLREDAGVHSGAGPGRTGADGASPCGISSIAVSGRFVRRPGPSSGS